MEDSMIYVGKVINTHGIKGELKILRLSDNPERFNPGNRLYIFPIEGSPQEIIIESQRYHKQYDLIKFVGYENINEVERFKNASLKVSMDELDELEEGQYYYHEIIGCEVFIIKGEKIGIVSDIFTTGANDVWTIKQANGKEVCIPYIDDVVKSINIGEKKILIEPMEGLLD